MNAITTHRRDALVTLLVYCVDIALLRAHLQATGWRESPHRFGQRWTAPLQADEEPFELLLTQSPTTIMADLRYTEHTLPLIAALENRTPLEVVLDLVPPAIRKWVEQGWVAQVLGLSEVGDVR